MPYGSAHTSDLPVVSTTLGPDYAEQINAAIEELRTTVDARVTPAGMQMNDDLSFLESGTYSGIVDLERVEFQNQASPMAAGAAPGSLFVSDGELYYNDVSGNQIQVTDGGALNVASSGGITGSGYGASGVEVNWSSGSSAYLMKSGAGVNDYAHVWCNDLLLNDGSGNYWTLASPALASDLTLTLPTAYPAATVPMLMSNAGVVSASGTLSNLVAVTTSGTITSGGLITASAGLTAAANQHVTVSGTGRFKHGQMTLAIPASAMQGDPADWNNAGFWSPASNFLYVPIMLPVGARLVSCTVDTDWDADTNQTAGLYVASADTGYDLVPNTDAVIDATGAGPQLVGLEDTVIQSGLTYSLIIDANADTGDVYGVHVIYDYP